MNVIRIFLIFSILGLAIIPAHGQNLPIAENATDKSIFLLDALPQTDTSAPPAKNTGKAKSPAPEQESRPKPTPQQEANQNDILVRIKFNDAVFVWDHQTEKAKIDAIIEKMQKKPSLRLAIYSYASGKPAKSSQYRRLALDRAWSIAEYFQNAAIDASRLAIFPIFQPIDTGFNANQTNLARDYIALKWLR